MTPDIGPGLAVGIEALVTHVPVFSINAAAVVLADAGWMNFTDAHSAIKANKTTLARTRLVAKDNFLFMAFLLTVVD